MFKVVRRKDMADGTVILNEIEAPMIARKARAGQFVNFRGPDALCLTQTLYQHG